MEHLNQAKRGASTAETQRCLVLGGAGKMGGIHAKVYSQLPDSELVAVVDVDGNKAAELAGKGKLEKAAEALVDALGAGGRAWRTTAPNLIVPSIGRKK